MQNLLARYNLACIWNFTYDYAALSAAMTEPQLVIQFLTHDNLYTKVYSGANRTSATELTLIN